MEKHAESKKDIQLLSTSFASAKKTRRGKECATFGCSNTFYDNEGTATGIHFVEFTSLLSQINRWRNLINRQNNKDGFVSSNNVLCLHNFMKTDIKK